MKKNWNTIKYIIIDIILINLSIIAAYYLRFGKNINMLYFGVYIGMAPFVTIGKIIVFHYFGMYKNLWKYASVDEIINLIIPIGISNGLVIIAIYFLGLNVPRSIYAIASFIDIFVFGVSRFGTRTLQKLLSGDFSYFLLSPKGKRVLIVGAGEAAGLLLQELRNKSYSTFFPVCAVDDNKSKIGKKINGVSILGDRYDIPRLVDANSIEEIIIAIPSIKNEDLKGIIRECEKTSCSVKIVPSISEIKEDIEFKSDVTETVGQERIKELLVKRIRNVDIKDLLGRKEVKLDLESISQYLKGKKIIVTGGGGSIGSEICRQIQRFSPKEIIVIDISEENIYKLLDEFQHKYNGVNINPIVASIRDRERIYEIFSEIKPDIVFHTAAHKHVHFMEKNPQEAIKNNVFGTLNVVQASHDNEVERFILISTDKAVNPTNVYGATKRICEMIVQGYSSISKTEFAAVRFGNVLGSNGSVIPLFKSQIERGGPVTITHPEIIRYFMTIPEAVSLVIQAGAMAKGGEIFILDMGEPVKIDSLARELIRLSGLEPDKDIKIEYIGLRPGEKLYEELLMAEEGLKKTSHEKIYVAKPMDIDIKVLQNEIESLKELDGDGLKDKLKEIVPTYRPKD